MALLDVCMPGLDGPRTLAELHGVNPALRVCFMSGFTGKYTTEELLALGATRFFEKPFSIQPLAEQMWQLALADAVGQYQSFLFLIGSVFVPLYAVAAVDFFLVSRQHWDVSATSRLRAAPVVAWACGFAAYQLVYPGTVPGWANFWAWVDTSIGFVPPGWLGSSVAAIAVGGLVMFISGLLLRHRQDARAEHAGERVS